MHAGQVLRKLKGKELLIHVQPYTHNVSKQVSDTVRELTQCLVLSTDLGDTKSIPVTPCAKCHQYYLKQYREGNLGEHFQVSQVDHQREKADQYLQQPQTITKI